MKHKKYSKRTTMAASVILVTVVCTILGFSALHGTENEYSYADNYPLMQDQKHMKEIELRDVLRNYDKTNINEVYVFLGDSDGEITNAYINIICQEKKFNSEMQDEMKALAAEELGLDRSNIYVDHMDFESYTSK